MEEEEEEEGEEQRYVFLYGLKYILLSRVIGVIARVFLWMISCSFPRVLLGDYPNLRFVEFMWVKS